MSIAFYALIAAVVLAIIFIKMTVVIIPQSETKIIERLGKYFATLNLVLTLSFRLLIAQRQWYQCIMEDMYILPI